MKSNQLKSSPSYSWHICKTIVCSNWIKISMESQNVEVHVFLPCHVALLSVWDGDFSAARYPVQVVYTTASTWHKNVFRYFACGQFLFWEALHVNRKVILQLLCYPLIFFNTMPCTRVHPSIESLFCNALQCFLNVSHVPVALLLKLDLLCSESLFNKDSKH